MTGLVNSLVGGAFLVVVGIALGLLGAGGSAIAVPVLVYIVGMEPHQAVGLSLLLVGASAVFGAYLNHLGGRVRWKQALLFAPSGVAGSWIGSKWSYLLSPRALLISFGVLLLVVALKMILEHEQETHLGLASPIWVVVSAAFAIGLVTGTLGVGGGFLIVPALLYLARLPIREAIATSLVVVAINSGVAFVGHVLHGNLDLSRVPFLLGCAIAGMAAGSWICQRSHPARLKKGFAFLLVGLALFMVWRNW